jgi:hypothetical protein
MATLKNKIENKLQETFKRYAHLTNKEESTFFGERVLEKKITEAEIKIELLCELLEGEALDAYAEFQKNNK